MDIHKIHSLLPPTSTPNILNPNSRTWNPKIMLSEEKLALLLTVFMFNICTIEKRSAFFYSIVIFVSLY